MTYCPNCGHLTSRQIPPGDNRLRDVCDHCANVCYASPKIIVNSIPVYNDQILLCRRAIKPRFGCWTLPGGYMEPGESMAEGAVRETYEEACATIIEPKLYFIANVPSAFQIHVFYRAILQNMEFSAGEETLETALFSPTDIPWWQLSFRTTFHALRYFIEDMKTGDFRCREMTLPPLPPGVLT